MAQNFLAHCSQSEATGNMDRLRRSSSSEPICALTAFQSRRAARPRSLRHELWSAKNTCHQLSRPRRPDRSRRSCGRRPPRGECYLNQQASHLGIRDSREGICNLILRHYFGASLWNIGHAYGTHPTRLQHDPVYAATFVRQLGIRLEPTCAKPLFCAPRHRAVESAFVDCSAGLSHTRICNSRAVADRWTCTTGVALVVWSAALRVGELA